MQVAHEKLLRVRGSRPEPVGWRLAFGQHGCIWSAFAILMFSLTSLALVGAASTGKGFFLGAAAVPALAGLACLYAGKLLYPAPETPERAVRNFLEFISRGNFKGAWDMLAPTEREPGAGVFPNFEAFRQYWRDVRRALGLRSGKLFYDEIAVETLAPDVAICRVLLDVAPQQLFLPAADGFRSVALGDQRSYFVQKMVVRCGDEWLIWSPALFGDDEADHSWLHTPYAS